LVHCNAEQNSDITRDLATSRDIASEHHGCAWLLPVVAHGCAWLRGGDLGLAVTTTAYCYNGRQKNRGLPVSIQKHRAGWFKQVSEIPSKVTKSPLFPPLQLTILLTVTSSQTQR